MTQEDIRRQLQDIRGIKAAVAASISSEGARGCADYEKALEAALRNGVQEPAKVKPQNILATLVAAGVKVKHGDRQ